LFLASATFLTLSCFFAVLSGIQEGRTNPTLVKRDPALQALLDKAGAYAKEYRQRCRDLVAEEKMIQREFDKKGKVKDQRRFISDYFFVTLPSDPSSMIEVRDIKTIDGRTVRRKERGLLELFEKKSSSAAEEAERLVKESTRHNLGRKRYTNMVNFGLFFLLPEYQDQSGTASTPTEEIQRVILESEATYSNFRRFSTDVKILCAEPSVQPEESSPK
jgi:hypothetical protein